MPGDYRCICNVMILCASISLRDGREIWIYGERVKDVTTHPAFRNTARMIARLYRMLTRPLLLPADFLMARMMLQGIKQRAEHMSDHAVKRVSAATPAAVE